MAQRKNKIEHNYKPKIPNPFETIPICPTECKKRNDGMGVGSAVTPIQLEKLQIPQTSGNGSAFYVGLSSFYNETSSLDSAIYVGTSASHNQPHCQNFTISANKDSLNLQAVNECVSTNTSRNRKADDVQKVVPSHTKKLQGKLDNSYPVINIGCALLTGHIIF